MKARAKRHGRSPQTEASFALEQAPGAGAEEIGQVLERWKRRFTGRRLAPSVDLVRDDRER